MHQIHTHTDFTVINFTKFLQLSVMVVSLLVVSFSVSANDADKKRLAEQAEEFQQGLTLAQKGSFKQALKIWNTLGKSDDLVPELKRAIENNVAVIYMKKEQYEQAKKRLDSALQSDPQIAVTLDNLNQIYAYDAQKAYQKIFKDTAVNQPKTKWLYFDVKQASLPTANVITNIKNADSVRIVKNSIEQWRQAWANQDVKSYLSFYDKDDFIPKNGMSHSIWEKGRYRSLQKPKFIKIFLDDIQLTPISDTMMRSRFLQKYHSDRFKDDVYKVLLWNKKDGVWKIIQEVVMHGQK